MDSALWKHFLTKISDAVSDSNINIHDEERQCVLKGDASRIDDDIRKTFISLNIKGNCFGRCDFDDNHYFNGCVSGNSVQIYDYGELNYFNYSV